MRKLTTSTINWGMLVKVTGWLLMIEAIFLCVPLAVTLLYGEDDSMAFMVTLLITATAGAGMAFCVNPSRHDMGKREGFLLTAWVWVVFSLFGMLPFLLGSVSLGVTDAFFESMSGFTTTGSSVIEDIDHLSHGIHIWRALMQWIGGMGIILFTLAVLPMLNSSGGMQMFNAEVTGITHDKLRPRVSSTAKRLWLVYSLLTLALVVLYGLGPMGWFDSVCHGFSTMSTGGFSTRAASIGAWDSMYVRTVTTIFMFIGGVNFSLIFRASTGDFRSAWSNETFRIYLLAIVVMLGLFDLSLAFNPSVADTWQAYTIDPLFQIVSAMTSTGYVINNFATWGVFVVSLLMVMMFFGACAGSTSGGAKLDRAIYVWKNSANELYRCIHPNHVRTVNLNGRIFPPELGNKVFAFLGLYVVVIFVGGVALTALDVPLVDAFFSSFSCVSNVGLSCDVTGYGGTYLAMPDCAKWLLSLLMLVGRLEVFTVLVLLLPSFWRR